MSSKEVRQLIKRAEAIGWEYLGLNGGDHHRIRWPATGDVVTLSATPGHSATSKAEADLARISGPLRPKPGQGRSKAQRAADRRRREAAPKPKAVQADPVKARPPEWKEKLQQLAEDLNRPPRFTACCACPGCGVVAVHWLRLPRPKPERGPVRVFDDGAGGTVEIHSFDGMTGPDESMYEVVRTCRECGKEFGQT